MIIKINKNAIRTTAANKTTTTLSKIAIRFERSKQTSTEEKRISSIRNKTVLAKSKQQQEPLQTKQKPLDYNINSETINHSNHRIKENWAMDPGMILNKKRLLMLYAIYS